MAEHPAAFPFARRYLSAGPYRLAYIDEGEGYPLLVFIHGNPTWSYLWRNVIPPLAQRCRCVALDLLGFGASDRPDIDYTWAQQYATVRAFMDELPARDVVLVLHDWGGPLGATWALDRPQNLRGLVFMETFLSDLHWEDYPWKWRIALNLLRAPAVGTLLNQAFNLQVPWMLNAGVHERAVMTPEVLARYTDQLDSARFRRPVGRFTGMLPFEASDETFAVVQRIRNNLKHLNVPMLLLTAEPGGIAVPGYVDRLRVKLPRLDVTSVGRGVHYLPEEQPEAVAGAIAAWLDARGLRL